MADPRFLSQGAMWLIAIGVVGAHGLFAVVTVLLVLLSALGVGGG
ncbi:MULTISPECIES: hypothetical protein [Streptosporangium]|uniref:Uncharacterized protein n=1 Tax=Streptosporangium jomthongense TaxID=1193683 RepID=A0ABV8EYX1_9ACTN